MTGLTSWILKIQKSHLLLLYAVVVVVVVVELKLWRQS